jgi:hypothetical protein
MPNNVDDFMPNNSESDTDYLLKQEWLCEKYGALFGQMPRFEPSTKRMSCCGHIQEVAISERMVVCQKCSTVHDRDRNAAISIEEWCRPLWLAAGCQTSSEAARAIDRRIPKL